MELIRPVTEESCRPHVGRLVCAVMNDGTHYYGYLKGVEDGKLVLFQSVQGPGTMSVSAVKAKSQIRNRLKGKGKGVTTKAFGVPFGGALALDLALLTLVFALPFFW